MLKMLFQFIKDPKHTGAVLPSSKFLAKKMVDTKIDKYFNIAEIGPGDGIFTKEILNKIDDDTNFFVMEINPNFAKKLKDDFPDLEVKNIDANEIFNITKEKNIEGLDIVISGIPWANFKELEQSRLLKNIYKSLKPEGYFITFAYIFPNPKAFRFRKKLHKTFKSVKKSKVVWKNFPPAFVYYCQK